LKISLLDADREQITSGVVDILGDLIEYNIRMIESDRLDIRSQCDIASYLKVMLEINKIISFKTGFKKLSSEQAIRLVKSLNKIKTQRFSNSSSENFDVNKNIVNFNDEKEAEFSDWDEEDEDNDEDQKANYEESKCDVNNTNSSFYSDRSQDNSISFESTSCADILLEEINIIFTYINEI
jgi:hypothetical protein